MSSFTGLKAAGWTDVGENDAGDEAHRRREPADRGST